MAYVNDNSFNTITKVARRATATLPQSTTGDIFSIDGLVRIKNIIGVVTTDIENQANNTKLIFDPDNGGANTDLCAVLDTADDGEGTVYTITGTFANALQSNANGVDEAQATDLILDTGDIVLSCAASNTGSVEWIIEYEPLEQVNGRLAEVTAQ